MASYQTTIEGTTVNVQGLGPEMPNFSAAAPLSNKEIKSQISDAKKSLEKEKPNLDSHGEKIISSTQGLLDSTAKLIQEKNKEERFQKLYRFTSKTIESGPSASMNDAVQNLMARATGLGNQFSNDATDLTSYIKETLLNLSTSSEVREVAIDFLDLLQSLMGELEDKVEETKTDLKTKENPFPANQPTDQNPKAKKAEANYEVHKQQATDPNAKLADKAKAGAQMVGDKLESAGMDIDNVKELTDEQIEKIRNRINSFLKRANKQPEYQTLVQNFLKYSEQIYDMLYDAKEEQKKTPEADQFKELSSEAWAILSDFAGKDNVLKFRKNLTRVLENIQKDSQIRGWIRSCRDLLLDLLKNPEKKADDDINKLIKEGRTISDKYRRDLNHLYSNGQQILEAIRNDPYVLDFQGKLEQLGRDLLLNSRGQPDLFVLENSMIQIKNLFVDSCRNLLVDVPFKRLDIQDEDMALSLVDMTIKGTGLVPEKVHVELSTASDFYFQKSPEAQTTFKLLLKMQRMTPEFKGVSFDYQKKTFPHTHDRGTFDLIFGGDGLSIDSFIAISLDSENISKARLIRLRVSLDDLTLNFGQTEHPVLDTLFAPLIAARLRTRLESIIGDFIHRKLRKYISQLNSWFRSRPFESMMLKGNETLKQATTQLGNTEVQLKPTHKDAQKGLTPVPQQ